MAANAILSRRLIPKVHPVFSYSTTAQLDPNPDLPFPSFRAAKSAILSESDPDNLAQIFIKSSQLPSIRRHRPIYHISIRKLARAKRFDLIDRIIHAHHNSPSLKSEGFWIRLIMLYSTAGMVDHAIRTLHQLLRDKPCHLSEKSLCALLSVCLNNSLPDKLHQMFKSIPEKLAVTPSVVSHNMVLKGFAQEKDLQSARNWIHQMYKDAKVLPNTDSYNILLAAYSKNGDMAGFDEVLKEISNKGLEYNLATYNCKISWLCKNKECARAKKLLDQMVSNGMKPNSATYNTIINGFCSVGDTESAKKVVQGMLADGHVSPCSLTHYTLIRSMVKEGEFDSALESCKEILRRKWIPPFEAMDGLVRGLVNMSRVEEAKEVVERMKKRLRGSAVDSWGKIEAAFPW